MTDKILSDEDRDFLAKCEEEFKDSFTENDEEFMKIYNSEPSKPPILENWWSSNSGPRNDRRRNRQYHPYNRHGNRDRGDSRHQSGQDRRNMGQARGYTDYEYQDDRNRRRYN